MARIEEELRDARAGGDGSALVATLIRYAAHLVDRGRLHDAREALDEAAGLNRALSRPEAEARCLFSAATLCRGEGHLDLAEVRARRAVEVAPPGTSTAAAAAVELGEIAALRGDRAGAVAQLTRALSHGKIAGMVDPLRAAILRKRALCRLADGEGEAAVGDLRDAGSLLERAGIEDGALRLRVEEAGALHQLGRGDDLEALLASTAARAQRQDDRGVLCDLELLRATRAIDAGDPERALAAARRAREHALAAVNPISYTGTAVLIAELCETLSDRVGAYEALAVGWVTISDLLGQAAGEQAFSPRLAGLRDKWGTPEFVAVRDRYEARRRRVLAESGEPRS